MMNKIFFFAVLLFFCLTVSAFSYTREEVVERGHLLCGVSTGAPGFSSVDKSGRWTGLDADFCRAVAAAVLGKSARVEFVPLAENEAFTALITGEVDILSRQSSWDFTRDSALAVDFTGVSYYDSRGIMIAKSLGAESLGELKRVRICSSADAYADAVLTEYLLENKVEFKVVTFDNTDLAVKGFEGGGCDLLSMPFSRLQSIQKELSKKDSSLVLPDTMSREPLGPVVRQGDDNWFDIVRWTLFALIDAEELGITSVNLEEMKIRDRLAVKNFFGIGGTGKNGLGLQADWAEQMVRQVGNYEEIYEKNLGTKSDLKIERGMNKLWSKGGLHYAPPLR